MEWKNKLLCLVNYSHGFYFHRLLSVLAEELTEAHAQNQFNNSLTMNTTIKIANHVVRVGVFCCRFLVNLFWTSSQNSLNSNLYLS